MDAFVEVKIGKNKTKTHVCKDGGVNPVWDDTMQFDLTGEEDVIRIKVYNKNMISDDVIGVARIPLNYLIMMSGHPNGNMLRHLLCLVYDRCFMRSSSFCVV